MRNSQEAKQTEQVLSFIRVSGGWTEQLAPADAFTKLETQNFPCALKVKTTRYQMEKY